MVTIRVPIPPMMVSNLLGSLGLIGFVFAIAALTDWRWGLLTASVIAVGMAYMAQIATAKQAAQQAPAAAATPIDRTLKRVS